MRGELLPVKVLTARFISNVSSSLGKALGLEEKHSSIALISTDCDDATYIALDEATKAANVDVVYGKSLYAGAVNASTALAGEVIGILAGDNPSDVRSGMESALAFLRGGIGFRSANDRDDVVYLAHCVSRTGTYLSGIAGVQPGQALAYLIAPPVEAVVGLDLALKAADVRLCTFFAPPSETNFGGGLLAGSQSACRAACEAFAQGVMAVAQRPLEMGERMDGI